MVNKTLLFQLAFRAQQTEWIPDSGGVWFIPFRHEYTGIDSDLIAELTEKGYLNIISVSYSGGDLTTVNTWTDTVDGRATALSSDVSYIWDNIDKNLYIRLDEYDDPRAYDIYIGVAQHISSQSFDDTVNSILYREDIKSIPDLSEEKDPLFFQKITFDEFSVKLNNAGHVYDFLIDNKVFGQVGQYYWGDQNAAFSTFTKIKEAKVRTYQFRGNEVILRLIDSRATLSRSVPVNTLNQTDYPDLKDDYVGAAKPLVYGEINRSTCIPLDDYQIPGKVNNGGGYSSGATTMDIDGFESDRFTLVGKLFEYDDTTHTISAGTIANGEATITFSPGLSDSISDNSKVIFYNANYTFMVADTEFHNIKSSGYQIIMDIIDKTSYVINFDAATGTFQLPAVHYSIGTDVTFTGGGYVDGAAVIENPLDIILDLLENYLELSYPSNSFNTTEWSETDAALQANDQDNTAIAIQEKKTLISIIEDICAGTGIGFLLERDGKYTARVYDPTALPILTVYENQWSNMPIVVGKEEELLTSATAKYNKALSKNSYTQYTDDSQEGAIYAEFGIYREKPFDTLYSDEAGAQAFAESIMDRSNDIGLTISGTLSDKYIDLSIIKIGLIAQIEVNRQTSKNTWSEWLGKMKCEIVGVYPDLENRQVEITFRKIESVDEFEYINMFDFNGDDTTDIYNFNGDADSSIIDMNRSNI